MTKFEILGRTLWPFMPPLYQTVRRHLKRILREQPECPAILDVGGRKSHYTIGLPSKITITDVPRQSELQEQLHLGVNEEIITQVGHRRSNIQEILIDDMTDTNLPDQSFQCISAIEVLEHIEEDDRFVSNVSKVLRNSGSFLMTTPNGDFVENTNPDHKRHYTKDQLESLLQKHFDEVNVTYIVRSGLMADLGRKSWSLKHPVQTLIGMGCNLVNGWMWPESSVAARSRGANHLLAIARKAPSCPE